MGQLVQSLRDWTNNTLKLQWSWCSDSWVLGNIDKRPTLFFWAKLSLSVDLLILVCVYKCSGSCSCNIYILLPTAFAFTAEAAAIGLDICRHSFLLCLPLFPVSCVNEMEAKFMLEMKSVRFYKENSALRASFLSDTSWHAFGQPKKMAFPSWQHTC